jgi:hypothetical protein
VKKPELLTPQQKESLLETFGTQTERGYRQIFSRNPFEQILSHEKLSSLGPTIRWIDLQTREAMKPFLEQHPEFDLVPATVVVIIKKKGTQGDSDKIHVDPGFVVTFATLHGHLTTRTVKQTDIESNEGPDGRYLEIDQNYIGFGRNPFFPSFRVKKSKMETTKSNELLIFPGTSWNEWDPKTQALFHAAPESSSGLITEDRIAAGIAYNLVKKRPSK